MDFVQGIVTSILATLLCFGGATMLTWIKTRWPQYGDLVRYWLASAASLAVLWFAMTGYVPFSKRQLQITPDNIEANLKAWFENVGLPFTKANLPDTYFSYAITTRTGTPIQVSRMTKDKPAYLQFASTLMMSPEHQAMMGTLTKDQIETATEEIALELAKTRVGFAIASMNLPQTGTNATGQTAIILQKSAPIAGFSESSLGDYVDDMEFTVTLVRATTSLALRRATAQARRSSR